jgi:hypothetical protein
MIQKINKYKKIIYIILLIYFSIGVWNGFRVFIDRKIFESEYVNNLCSNNPSDIKSGEYPSPEIVEENKRVLEEYCQPKIEQKKFTKFIWFLTDGLPYYYSKDFLTFYKEHGVLFNVDLPGFSFLLKKKGNFMNL